MPICFGCAAGAVIGGIVGTITWPLVGTFFGAVIGVFVGAGAGIIDGLVLTGVARQTRSAWVARLASGIVSSGFALITASRAGTFRPVAFAAGQATLVAACLLLGAVLGPMIAYGMEPISFGRGPTRRPEVCRSSTSRTVAALPPLAQTGARLLLWGAGAGGALGGGAGLIIGISTYLPTAPFAAVEGAVLGSVSGLAIALLVGATALLPKLRMRR